MANTYTQLYFHLVFATKNRYKIADTNFKESLHKYITGILKNKQHHLISVNFHVNHIHVLFSYNQNTLLGELVKIISHSNRNIFPGVETDSRILVGVVLLDEVRNIMFRPELYNRFTVKKLMISPPATINHELPMEKVMEIFEDTGAWNLPVVDEQKRYIGYVSKSKIFNSYRHVLVHFSDE